jgi:FkbM family methyltransferase
MSDPLRLFVGTGVEGLRPVGYKTIDISAGHDPDIVADASALPMIESGTADEFYASHVLEHFSWPRALLVLLEWARVLKIGGMIKIAVPDMEIYANFLMNNRNPFNIMNDIYGGHWVKEGGPQGHHFGYTRRMLTEVLTVMGFGEFDMWRSDLPEAANTWVFGENQEKLGISLNISAIKQREPLVDIDALAHRIRHHDIRESFMVLVRNLMVDETRLAGINDIDTVLFQKLNYRFLEASHLATVYRDKYNALVEASQADPRQPSTPEVSAGEWQPRRLIARGINVARRITDLGASNARAEDSTLKMLAENSNDAIARLVNIETKINHIMGATHHGLASTPEAERPSDPFSGYAGSSDQAFGHLTYAQHGEDLIVANIFALLGVEHPSYIDAGASHPLKGSNTALLYSRGSRGIVVEANPALMSLWAEIRPQDLALNLAVAAERGEQTLYRIDEMSGRNTTRADVAQSFVNKYPEFRVQDTITVEATTLNDIVMKHAAGRWPDFLSVDLEGLDYAVLDAADFSGDRPTVICVEWRDVDGGDASEQILPVLTKRGYFPIFRTWGNLIAVHGGSLSALGIRAQ